MRDGEDHKRVAMRLKNPKTQIEMISKESSSGCRYSVLLELDYFDSPRFLVMDPMHNLFLGSDGEHLECWHHFVLHWPLEFYIVNS